VYFACSGVRVHFACSGVRVCTLLAQVCVCTLLAQVTACCVYFACSGVRVWPRKSPLLLLSRVQDALTVFHCHCDWLPAVTGGRGHGGYPTHAGPELRSQRHPHPDQAACQGEGLWPSVTARECACLGASNSSRALFSSSLYKSHNSMYPPSHMLTIGQKLTYITHWRCAFRARIFCQVYRCIQWNSPVLATFPHT